MSSAQIRLEATEAGWRELAVEISSILQLHQPRRPRRRIWPLVLGVILFVGTALPIALWPAPAFDVESPPPTAVVVPLPPRVAPPRPPDKPMLHKRQKVKKKLRP